MMDINQVSTKISENLMNVATKISKMAGIEEKEEIIKFFNMLADRVFFYKDDRLCRIEGVLTPEGKFKIRFFYLSIVPGKSLSFFLRSDIVTSETLSKAIVMKVLANYNCIRYRAKQIDIGLKRNRKEIDSSRIYKALMKGVVIKTEEVKIED